MICRWTNPTRGGNRSRDFSQTYVERVAGSFGAQAAELQRLKVSKLKSEGELAVRRRAAALSAAEAYANTTAFAQAELPSAEAALVDWAGLICQLCKRRLKDRPTLQKHVDESALHQTNLAAWRDERAAAATAAAAAAAEADRREIRSERPRDDHRGKPEVSAQDRVVKVGGATFKVPSGTPAPRGI